MYELTRQYYRNPNNFVQTKSDKVTNGIKVIDMTLREFHDYCVNHKRNKGLKFPPFEFRGTSHILTLEEWILENHKKEEALAWKQYYRDSTRNLSYDRRS